jgi:hypothetical protein
MKYFNSQTILNLRYALKLIFWYIRGKRVKENKGFRVFFAYRSGTWVYWNIYLSMASYLQGRSILIVYSSSALKNAYGLFYFIALRIIKAIAQETVNLDTVVPNTTYLIDEKLLIQQIAYDNRVEELTVYENNTLLSLLPKYEIDSQKMLTVLHDLKMRYKIDSFWIFNGIIYTSCIVLQFARQYTIKIFTFEGWSYKPGLMIYGIDKPVLQFEFREQFEKDKKNNLPKLMDFYDDYNDFRNGKDSKNWFVDFYNMQRKAKVDYLPEELENWNYGGVGTRQTTILIATNMVGDSATLGRNKFFDSQAVWLKHTLEYLINNTTYQIIVRVHPAEQWKKNKLQVSLGDVVKPFGEKYKNRVYPIFAEQKVNTLALAKITDTIIVWTSTVGADFATLGIPVITAAKSNYEDFDFTTIPSTKLEYDNLLTHLDKRTRLTEEKIEQAKCYFYYLLKGDAEKVFGNNYDYLGIKIDQSIFTFLDKLEAQ